MKKDSDHTYTLRLLVRNRPGVLVRCAQVFNRRGHNIEALHVQPDAGDHTVSIMTVTAFGDVKAKRLIMAQLAKLVDVLDTTEEEQR